MTATPSKNDTPDKALVEVTQADREAAAKVRPYSHNSALILDGQRDGTDIVQAAAHARLAALSQPQHGGLVEAIEQAIAWHEEQDKAISKWPGANTGDNRWRRLEHQEQANTLRAALASNSPVVGEDVRGEQGLLRNPLPYEEIVASAHEAVRAGDYRLGYLRMCEAYGKLNGSKPTPTDTADRACTCHPDDRPEGPCPQKFAARDCSDTAGRREATLHDKLIGVATDLRQQEWDEDDEAAQLIERAASLIAARPTGEA